MSIIECIGGKSGNLVQEKGKIYKKKVKNHCSIMISVKYNFKEVFCCHIKYFASSQKQGQP